MSAPGRPKRESRTPLADKLLSAPGRPKRESRTPLADKLP